MSARVVLAALLATGYGFATSCGFAFATPARAEADAGPPTLEHYLLHCSGCHGADGRGVPGTTPDLASLGWLVGREGGRAYVAGVPGVAQASLPDAELAALLNWAVARFGGVAVQPPYTAAEVRAHRAAPIRDTIGARRALGQATPREAGAP